MRRFMSHKSCSVLGYDMGNPIESLLPFALTISDRNGPTETQFLGFRGNFVV